MTGTQANRMIIGIGIALIVGLCLLGWLAATPAPSLIVWHLGTGWFRHPLVNFPHLGWNPVTIALALLGFLAVTGILHAFLRRSVPDRPYSLSLRITTLALVISAAAIAMTGIVHQLGWLGRTRMTYDKSRAARLEAAVDLHQIALTLLELNHEGIFPNSLVEIQQHCPVPDSMLLYRVSQQARDSEPYRFLVPGKDILSLPPDTPVLAAFGIDGDRVVYVTPVGAIEHTTLEQFGRMMEERKP